MTRLPQPRGPVWRREGFLALLARLGASKQELSRAAEIVAERETALAQMGFTAAVDHALAESRAHYEAWAAGQPADVAEMDEAQIDAWLAGRLKEL